MKVCVLSDPEWGDPFDPSYYLQGYEWELHDLHRPHVKEELTALAQRGFDIYLNMCDGAADENRPGLDVVLALEELNLPFTGAASHYYEPTREQMKYVCQLYDIGAPCGVAVTGVNNLKTKIKRMQFPMIVKHPNSYGSVGLIKESRVMCFTELEAQISRMLGLFGSALVEEFIEGREFSVLVSENPNDLENPITYVPVEVIFPPGESFKHTDMKWYRYEELICNPVTDPDLSGRLRDMSAKLFVGLRGTGYGRCDIRMDAQGELFMLEINPQGAIFYPPEAPGMADYILRFDPRGHAGFVDLLFRAALALHKRKNEVALKAVVQVKA
jgi:D-alanine-D-alanine ligase